MAFEFRLPDIGEGVVEGELVKWFVAEGERVAEDAPLFEVLTDKVTAQIPSPVAGTIGTRHFAEGDVVPVGAVVLTIETAAGAKETVDAAAEPVGADTPAAPMAGSAAPPVTTAVAVASVAAPRQKGERVRATPATRKLARTLGVDIHEVDATGQGGRVTREDVEGWAAGVAAGSNAARVAPTAGSRDNPSNAAAAGDETRKLIGLRRRISDNMRLSMDQAAHFTYVEEIDFTAIVAMKDALAAHGFKTTYLPFVMKAVAIALKLPEFELLNAHVDYSRGEIVVRRSYHLGIATATDAGLVVPVLRDVDRKSLRALTTEIGEMASGARSGGLTADRYQGSTFTITSLGKIGGMFATPIINPPETAILGLHKVEKRPVVVDGEIVIRERMYMSCSFDHRLIDGHIGAAFVQAVRELLETPALLMAELA